MTRAPGVKQWLWTWDVVFFGYRHGDDLWTHVGRFHGDEICDPNGGYLGEVRRLARLIGIAGSAGAASRSALPPALGHHCRR